MLCTPTMPARIRHGLAVGRLSGAVVAVAIATGALSGCAINISEMRSPRVLRGGEINISQANHVVVPTSSVAELYKQGEVVVEAVDEGRDLTDGERHDLTKSAISIALSSPGYGTHLDFAIGLGYRFDFQVRAGNGIYGTALRRGFDLGETTHAAIGWRGAYNGGSSLVPYLDNINGALAVSDMNRYDNQVFGHIGIEFGQWGKLWTGAKWMASWFDATIGGDALPQPESIGGRVDYIGGFVGGAVGFRWFHLIGELNVTQVKSEGIRAIGENINLKGWIVAVTWGFQITM